MNRESEEMSLFEELKERREKLAVIGLGYVGMPLAVAFAEKINVLGFDLNKEKIEKYRQGKDPTGEVGDRAIAETSVDFTPESERLKEARFYIVAVPTPVNQDKTPDLNPVESASRLNSCPLPSSS